MARIVKVTKRWSGYESVGELSGRRATIIYDVETDVQRGAAEAARRASGIPQPGFPYQDGGTFDPQRVVQSVRATPRSPTLYEVRVRYTTPSGSGGSDDRSIHPLDRPPEVRSDFITQQAEVDTDVNGEAITTVNGEGFDPPLAAQKSDMRLTIRRNEGTVNLAAHRAWGNVVDTGGIFGQQPGLVKLNPITTVHQVEQFDNRTIGYWQTSYTLIFREPPDDRPVEETWYARVLNRGFLVKVSSPTVNGGEIFDLGSPSAKVQEELENRDDWPTGPVTKPVLIDEAGFAIPPDSEQDPHWLTFQVYKEGDLRVWKLEEELNRL